MDDLADSIIAMGRDAFLAVYHGQQALPDRATWEDLPTIGDIIVSVYDELFDAIDDE